MMKKPKGAGKIRQFVRLRRCECEISGSRHPSGRRTCAIQVNVPCGYIEPCKCGTRRWYLGLGTAKDKIERH